MIFEKVIEYVGFGIFSAKVAIRYADCFIFDQGRNDHMPIAAMTANIPLISFTASIKSSNIIFPKSYTVVEHVGHLLGIVDNLLALM